MAEVRLPVGARLPIGWLALVVLWSLGWGVPARAQSPTDGAASPAPAFTASDLIDALGPAIGPQNGGGESGKLGFFDLVGESLFGDATEPWRPLPLRTFFTEGWWEPWDYPTESSGGAPRQGWINALDGVFYRLWFINFSYSQDYLQNGNQYFGSYTLFLPISRRFQFRFDVPFIDSNKGGVGNHYVGNFGDFTVTPRFLLSESKDLTQVLALGVRTPTGYAVNGNGQTTLSPQYEMWYGGLPRGWVIRGGTGVVVPMNSVSYRTLSNYNLAVGKYWTPHDSAPFGDFVTYLSVRGFSTLDSRGPEYTYVSLTPGFRTHLGNDWYALGGVEVPVTGPKSQNFSWAPIFWLLKIF